MAGIAKKPRKSRSGGGARKIGRDRIKCKRYRDEHRKEKNKARRIAKQKRLETKKRAKLIRRREAA